MLAATDNYLEGLNSEQRRAVEHGVSPDGTIGSPLLVIALHISIIASQILRQEIDVVVVLPKVLQ